MSQYRRPKKTKKKKTSDFFLALRLFLCFLIICTATAFKLSGIPEVRREVETIAQKLGMNQAVEVIKEIGHEGEKVVEVFAKEKKENEEAEQVFNSDFYLTSDVETLKQEAEKNKKMAELEAKQLSIEALSFSMSPEELSDDTKAEAFKIPPPTYCSYNKEKLNIKYSVPLRGIITSRFGYRDHPIIEDASFHTGLDIAAKKGSTISAFADGTVEEAGKNATYGNYLLISHGGGIKSFYGHNSKLNVKKGQRVSKGQKVAEVGTTGMSTGPHLHFEIRKNNIRLDPSYYISPERV